MNSPHHHFFGLYGFIDSTAKEGDKNKVKERGSDMQQRDLGRESNPGQLLSLSTWDDRCSLKLSSSNMYKMSWEGKGLWLGKKKKKNIGGDSV